MYIEKVEFSRVTVDANDLFAGDVFKDSEDNTYLMIIDYPYMCGIRHAVDLNSGYVYEWHISEKYPVFRVDPVLAVNV